MNKLLPLSMLVLVASCRPVKKGDESSTKSLDNVGKAPAAQTVNECGIEYTGTQALNASVTALALRIEAAAPYKNAVIGALTAAPDNLLKPFLGAGGKIVVTADVATACKDTPFSAAEKAMTGAIASVPACWKADPGHAPVIYLKPSVKLIKHDVVRLLGYFYTEFFVAKISDPAAPAPFNDVQWKAAATAFAAERDALAGNFLLDLEPKNKALHDSLVKIQSSDAMRFGNYIFAEALDSFYCSAKARSTFAKDFHLTYLRFTDSGNANSVVNQFGSR